METTSRGAVEHLVKVVWDAAGLRCDPEEAIIDSRRGDRVVWELESERRNAQLKTLTFDDGRGPFREMRADGKKRWVGKESRGAAYGRYKYSIWVEDDCGTVELDPYILDTDRP